MIDFVAIPKARMEKFDELKSRLEYLVKIKLKVDKLENTVQLEGEDGLDVLKCSQVVRAFGRGFDADACLNLLDDEYKLEIISIAEHAGKSKQRLITLRGRLIGTGGKTKALIENATGVKLAIYGKTVAIIGRWDRIPVASQAVGMILRGSKHNSVYKFLEEQKIR